MTPTSIPPRLAGKTAFVTGAASGIGAATARRLAAEGAKVIVADIDEKKACALAAEIDGLGLEVDVTDLDSVDDAVATGERVLGPIHLLVNNAGGGDAFAFFVDTDQRSWDYMIDLNLRGTLACTRAVLPGMYERRSGVIVNVASEAGRVGTPAGATYSAAKAGVIGFTKAIAIESARFGVRCNAVAPGPIETPLLNGAAEAAGERGQRIKKFMIDATVMRRSGVPEEVAGAIAFLVSDDASYVTGHTLPVSGGLSMW